MREYFLNHKKVAELLSKDKLVVVDGGARGDLFKPMGFINPQVLQIIRFEPDADATINNSSNDIVITKALWHQRQTINVNIAIAPSSSSVYPFNEALQYYIDPYKSVRKTKKVVSIDAIALDDCITEYGIDKIDFIKLDIHGAEYETLKGGQKVLQNTLGLLIESWVIPIHKGQKTRGDVERLALDNDFYVFEENVVAKWSRQPEKFSRKQPVAVDTLFFKDILLTKTSINQIQLVKLIGLADLFKHFGFAMQLMEYGVKEKVLDASWKNIITQHINNQNKKTIVERIKNKILNRANRWNDCTFK